MNVSGRTKLIPIIGSPIDGVVSPPAINAALQEGGFDALMVPMNIYQSQLPQFWSLLRASPTFLGCSVTYPHKQAAFDEVNSCTPRAQRLGALNTICRLGDGELHGDAVDGLALVRAIKAAGATVEGSTARIKGVGGGAGRAIADAFCEAGIEGLVLEEIDQSRLEASRSIVSEHWPKVKILPAGTKVDILVNATSLGKSPGDESPFCLSDVEDSFLVCDIAGSDNVSRLSSFARKTGTQIVDSHAMGYAQVDTQFAVWALSADFAWRGRPSQKAAALSS